MKRDEAIKVLNTYDVNFDEYTAEEIADAIDMAIEALSADAVEVKAEQLPPKVPTEWINDGMVLVPQHDWIEMQKELEGYVSADAVQGEWGHMMIDGNKLMLALSEWWYSSFGLEETEESKAIHKVMDEVERYVDHEKSADYWIPCSDRLPEYRKTVLISTFWGVKTGYLDSTEAYGDFWDIIEDDGTAGLHSIYAWMPLPNPYREDGEA